MKLRFASMTVGLAVGVTAAVTAACAGGAYIYSTHHFQSLLETARQSALAEGDLIRVALEHQMIENDRSLIGRMVQSFGRQGRVERLVILDRNGVERYAAGRPTAAGELQIGSPTCQACHQYPPAQRGSSRVIEAAGGALLRTVIPIRNRQECYGCHDAAHRINGILILDYNAGEIQAALTRDLRWMVATTAALTLLLVGAIALLIRLFLLRRLQRFETAARQIAAGDLNQRVPAQGSDTVAWLAREFNTMADSVTGLLGEVRNERERLETVINSIDDGIVVLTPERKIIAANDAFLRRTGHVRAEALGCGCRELGQGACNVSDCPTLSCLRSGDRQVRICERRSSAGAVAWEEVHASPMCDANGNLVQVVEVWRDISERRAAEAQLAESHRLTSVGMLASGFSHELNTPLATVLTCVEGILRDVSEQPGANADLDHVKEIASIAREQILRCRGITQHFLRMSRGQNSGGDIVDISAAIQAVEGLVSPTARSRRVRVTVVSAPEGAHVRADGAELENVLVNLLLNAIQACEAGGRVEVCVDEREGSWRIRVSDNGCGIRMENRKRIFEPFFSLRPGGTGLGLFLSLNFVRKWGGDISVDSTPGAGSTFEVTLPVLCATAETVA